MSRLEQQVCGAVDNTSALPTAPQTQQQQQKRRTYDSLLKADICTRYRQQFAPHHCTARVPRPNLATTRWRKRQDAGWV